MFNRNTRFLPATLLLALGLLSLPAQAQITSDGTTNTFVIPFGPAFAINGGATSGTNLFHSFSEFSVPTGRTALFNNNANIANIFARVTGSNLSNIDGILATQNPTNLFLLNPKGIIFGPNATLAIGGSFFASTAESIVFKDGIEFSAAQPNSALLSVNVPLGLQMGSNPGTIVNQSQTVFMGQTVGLATIAPQTTIGLVGGEVNLTGGGITSVGGRIEIGAIGSNGFVGLVPDAMGYRLNYDSTNAFANINLSQRAFLNSLSGSDIRLRGDIVHLAENSQIIAATNNALNGGNIDLIARQIKVDGGASTLTATTASGTAGRTTLRASESIEIKGLGYAKLLEANLRTLGGDVGFQNLESEIATFTTGSGNAGAIIIETASLSIKEGIRVIAGAIASGSNQPITISASEGFELVGSSVSNNTGIGSTGNGNNIVINTPQLSVRNGGFINTSSFGSGAGGGVAINAIDIELVDERPNIPPVGLIALTTIGSSAFGAGSSGDTRITTETLRIRGGAAVFAGSLAQENLNPGPSGNIIINASKLVEVAGISAGGVISSTISTTSYSNSSAGDISITTGELILRDSGEIKSETWGTAGGGNLSIQASEKIDISGAVFSPTTQKLERSNISVSAEFPGLDLGILTPSRNVSIPSTGNAGSLSITTSNLSVRDRGRVAVSSETAGNAGSLNLAVDTLRLEQDGAITGATAGGDGGQLSVQAQNGIILRDRSAITSSASPTAMGRSGDIRLSAGFLELTDSQIAANNLSSGGQGGSIDITTRNNLKLTRSGITSTTASGNGGDLNLQLGRILLMRDNSLISTTAGQAGAGGNGGNINIAAPFIVGVPNENSDITANAFTGNGGNIQITTQGIFGLEFRPQLTPQSDITASSQLGVNGTVTIDRLNVDPAQGLTELSVNLTDARDRVASNCAAIGESRFVVTGRGGLPTNPNRRLQSDRAWVDMRNLSEFREETTTVGQQVNAPITEANSWRVNEEGNVELVAVIPHAEPQTPNTNCAGTSPKTP
ncbi:S-layer family protein [Lusitaniella coriacea LEGE 07157]|uniref:S-layer family protein n=1 Tax=Lusitaniella coriacea LEGE 07157 TaxID=945747 RepID=A0A8J7E117_9CYAN|nr:S-layer family protein [Lusitaniella coriacea]MBE9118278.1 S-layer family protein [Lusitaniella coriacea LEGE 07157]